MSSWAAIVYGRSYHLDFRFITLPHDFTAPKFLGHHSTLSPPLSKLENLAKFPRWSLFKKQRLLYCWRYLHESRFNRHHDQRRSG